MVYNKSRRPGFNLCISGACRVLLRSIIEEDSIDSAAGWMVGLVLLLVAQSIMDTACFQKIGKIFFPVDLKFNGMEPTLSIPHIDSWVRVRWENT
jgi:hypothetical protein